MPPWSIKTWTFEETPVFRRLPVRLRVGRVHEPNVAVHDEATQIVVIANLPGVKRSNLGIDVHGDILSIEAMRKEPSGRVNHYHRELMLPIEVSDVPIAVTLDKGLLEVRMKPKPAKRSSNKADGEARRR